MKSSAQDNLSTAAGILFGYAIVLQHVTGRPTGGEAWNYLLGYYLAFFGVLVLVVTTIAGALWFCIYCCQFAAGKGKSALKYTMVLQWTTFVVCVANVAAALYLDTPLY